MLASRRVRSAPPSCSMVETHAPIDGQPGGSGPNVLGSSCLRFQPARCSGTGPERGEWHGSCSKDRARCRAEPHLQRGRRGGRHPQSRPHRRAVHCAADEDARSRRDLQGLEEQACQDRARRHATMLSLGDMLTGPIGSRHLDRPGRRRQGCGRFREDERQVRNRGRGDGRRPSSTSKA